MGIGKKRPLVRKTREGCGGLRGENPGAFLKGGPIFQDPFSWPEIGFAKRVAGTVSLLIVSRFFPVFFCFLSVLFLFSLCFFLFFVSSFFSVSFSGKKRGDTARETHFAKPRGKCLKGTACCTAGEEFPSRVEICRKSLPARNFGQPQPSRVSEIVSLCDFPNSNLALKVN